MQVLGAISFSVFSILLAVGFFYAEEIGQAVKVFFENRAARKVAKKLKLIDKGLIPFWTITTVDSRDYQTQTEYAQIHDFCREPLRIGLLEKESVKWCSKCECILFEEDRGGGNGDSSPHQPVPPDVKVTADTLFEKLKKQPS